MLRIVRATVFFAVMGLLAGSPFTSHAVTRSTIAETFKKQMRNFQRDMTDAEVVLKAKAPGEWSKQELEKYLFNSFFAIYNATAAYTFEYRGVPSSWETLRDLGPLQPWPGNPLDNWDPMKWVTETSDFSPGNMVLQVCPPELYSFPENPAPMTFVLSIFGPTENYEPVNPVVYHAPKWGVYPAGTAFMAGFGVEPASVTKKKMDEEKQRKE